MKQLKFKILLLGGLTIGSVSMQAQRFDDNTNKKLSKVKSLVEAGNYEKSKKLIEELKEEQPNSPHLLAASGHVDLAFSEWESAEKEFKGALDLDKQSASAWLGMAELQEVNKDYNMATASVERAFFHNEEFSFYEPIVRMKSKMHLRNGEFGKADELLSAAMESDIKSSAILCELSVVKHLQGKKEEALELIRKCPALFGETTTTYTAMGVACNRMGLYSDAIDFLREANEIEVGITEIYTNVAHSYYMTGELKKAESMLETAIEEDVSDCSAAVHLQIRSMQAVYRLHRSSAQCQR